MQQKTEYIINIIGNANEKATQLNASVQHVDANVNKFRNSLASIRDAGFAFQTITSAVNSVTNALNGAQSLYNIQAQAETKLETVMRQRTGATDEQIESIKALASEQQKLGIIGDEIQLSGAQQLTTFINQKESIDTLLPAMNNLLAQQKGINATAEDATNIGNLMGKVMQGQTSALTRVGITFTEAQEKVLKFGSEQERAAMLSQVITDNVGNMNEALAGTDFGSQKQLSNTIGDIRERIGKLWIGIQAQLMPAVEGLVNIAGKAITFIEEWSGVLTVCAIAVGSVVAVMKGWIIAQTILNVVMAMNPVVLIIAGVVALIGVIVYLCSKITGWGSLWEGVMGFMKFSFYAFIDGVKLYFTTWINGFLIGLDKVKIGWYKFKEACGLGDSTENQAAIAEINADVEKRQQAIVDGAKAVMENANKAKESLAGIKMGWGSGDDSKDTSSMGTQSQLLNAVSGGSSGMGGGSEGGSGLGKSSEAIATGGTRTTNITITLKNMVENINFNGSISEKKEEVERQLAEVMFRVLNMAQSSVG